MRPPGGSRMRPPEDPRVVASAQTGPDKYDPTREFRNRFTWFWDEPVAHAAYFDVLRTKTVAMGSRALGGSCTSTPSPLGISFRGLRVESARR